MKDALQPAPQKDLVIGLEVDGNTLPHELWHILSGHERNEVAAVIANEEIKFYAVDRESSHPRKRTSSGNLWQQRQGRATESAVARLVAGAVEGSKHDEQVIHMACHRTLVGMSKEFDDLVILCILGSLTQCGYVVAPFWQEGTSAVRTAVTRRTFVVCPSPTSLFMDHYHSLALGGLLATMVSDPKLTIGLAASALRTQIINQTERTVHVSLLRRCRRDRAVVASIASLGRTEVCTQYEVHRMESNAGGSGKH